MTPSPIMTGNCSEKLTVRKNAIASAVGGRTTQAGPKQAFSHPTATPVVSCQSLRRLARQTFGDRGGAFKSSAGTERGDGGLAARDQQTPGGARTLDRHCLDARDQFVDWDRPAPGEHLAGELLGACTRAFEPHQASHLHLPPLPPD